MKKLLCLLLTFTMVFGFASCKAARLAYWEISDCSDEITEESVENSKEESMENSMEESQESTGFVPDESDEVSTETEESSEEESSEGVFENTSTPLMWKVTSADSDGVIWLFGSIHVADESAYPLPNAVLEAFDSCDALAVECDITAGNIDYQSLYASMMYTDNSTIDQHIPAEIYEAASAIIIEAYGESVIENLKHFKPIFWFLMIEELLMSDCQLSYDYGIDRYFLELADEESKNVLEIESAQLQYDMLAGFSEPLQEFLLTGDVYSNTEDYLERLDDTYEAWKSGDITILEELFFSEPPAGYYNEEELALLEEYNKAMVFDRNVGMVDTAKEYLVENMEIFYVVGEGHMVGDQGIVQLLTDDGYTVELITSYSYNEI